MPGTITFHPTERDYLIANRAWFRRALLTRRFAGTVAVGAGAVAAIGAAITWHDPDATVRWAVTSGMVIGFVAFMLLMTGVSWLVQPFTSRRLFRQHRALNREFEVAWDERGMRYRSDDNQSRHAWADYHGWYDGRGVVLLMLNDRLFQFIPHRVLTPAQLADLRAVAPRAGEIAPPPPSG